MFYLTSGPGHGWLPLLPPTGLLPSPHPPLSSCPTRLLVLRHVAGIGYRLKGALVFLFILGWEHCAAWQSVAVHRREASVAAEAAPPLVAWVAVAWRAVTRSAVAGGAVAGSVAKLALVFTCRSVGAPANSSSRSVTRVPIFVPQAGGRDSPDCLMSSSFTFQEPVELRKTLNRQTTR